jgi:hypothetical protein
VPLDKPTVTHSLELHQHTELKMMVHAAMQGCVIQSQLSVHMLSALQGQVSSLEPELNLLLSALVSHQGVALLGRPGCSNASAIA